MAPDDTNPEPEQADDESREVHQRLVLPLMIPAAVFLFAMLAIYGLSRIFIDLQDFKVGDVGMATPLALAVAVAILGVAWYMISNPRVPRGQIVFIMAVAVALLLGGTIWAAIHDEAEPAAHAVTDETPTPVDDGGTPTSDGTQLEISAEDLTSFSTESLEATADEPFTVTFDNRDESGIPHNFAIYDSQEAAEAQEPALEATEVEAGPLVQELAVDGLAAGDYFFQCDVHPTTMLGTLTVE